MYTAANVRYLGRFVSARMWKLSRYPDDGGHACYCLVYLQQESRAAYISKGILEKWVAKHIFNKISI